MASTITVPIVLGEGASLPSYATEGSAGADLRSSSREDVTIEPMDRALIPAGFFLGLPEGFEAQVRSRSGLAVKGIVVANSPGTIDSDYRGEIKVILMNFSREPFTVRHGDRIAQMVIAPVSRASFYVVSSLAETARGEGGFGSTGI